MTVQIDIEHPADNEPGQFIAIARCGRECLDIFGGDTVTAALDMAHESFPEAELTDAAAAALLEEIQMTVESGWFQARSAA